MFRFDALNAELDQIRSGSVRDSVRQQIESASTYDQFIESISNISYLEHSQVEILLAELDPELRDEVVTILGYV
jgi:hypothetical protein